jgi:GNAT superfamily N-acetyltransferase
MNVTIRDVTPETDFVQLAPILSEAWEEPTSVQQLYEWYDRRPEGWIGRRAVMVTDTGQVIGYSYLFHEPWMGNGRFHLIVIVSSDYRRQGYGQQLYESAVRWAEPHQVARFSSEAQVQCLEGLVFAQKRGFVIDRQLFKSKIELAA